MGELRYDGQVAVVTGAGGGLGKAHAMLLAARGASVVVNDLSFEITGARDATPQQVVADIVAAGGRAVYDGNDVLDGDAIIRTAIDTFDRVDIVINNAGVAGGGPIDTGDEKEWDRTISTTLHGSIAVTRAAWPHMRANGGGAVVLTASPAMWGSPGSGAYCAAKASMFGLNRALAMEGAPHKIRVNSIMPSAWTRLTGLLPEGALTGLLQNHYPPEAVASFVAYLCHRDSAVSGEMFSVGGGRAARVVLGEAKGAIVDSYTPDSWVAKIDSVMDTDGLGFPASMLAEVDWQTENMPHVGTWK